MSDKDKKQEGTATPSAIEAQFLAVIGGIMPDFRFVKDASGNLRAIHKDCIK